MTGSKKCAVTPKKTEARCGSRDIFERHFHVQFLNFCLWPSLDLQTHRGIPSGNPSKLMFEHGCSFRVGRFLKTWHRSSTDQQMKKQSLLILKLGNRQTYKTQLARGHARFGEPLDKATNEDQKWASFVHGSMEKTLIPSRFTFLDTLATTIHRRHCGIWARLRKAPMQETRLNCMEFWPYGVHKRICNKRDEHSKIRSRIHSSHKINKISIHSSKSQ